MKTLMTIIAIMGVLVSGIMTYINIFENRTDLDYRRSSILGYGSAFLLWIIILMSI